MSRWPRPFADNPFDFQSERPGRTSSVPSENTDCAGEPRLRVPRSLERQGPCICRTSHALPKMQAVLRPSRKSPTQHADNGSSSRAVPRDRYSRMIFPSQIGTRALRSPRHGHAVAWSISGDAAAADFKMGSQSENLFFEMSLSWFCRPLTQMDREFQVLRRPHERSDIQSIIFFEACRPLIRKAAYVFMAPCAGFAGGALQVRSSDSIGRPSRRLSLMTTPR